MHLYHFCHSDIRAELKRSFQQLSDTLEKEEVPSDVWTTIKLGISTYLNIPATGAHPSPRTAALERAYIRQTKIGWHNFLKRRISSAWGDVMRDHYKKSPPKTSLHTHRRFRELLITTLWTIYDNIWKVWNSMLHDPTDVDALGNIQLNDRVGHYYDNNDDLLGPGDQHLVSKDIQELYSLSIPRQRN
jgi:hypothetical protein